MARRYINLTFHGIGATERRLASAEAEVWVDRGRFLTMLDSVADRRDVRISFDDGNASDLEHALPALRERGLRATFFVVAGTLGTPGFLTADDVRELAGGGMRIGCHGMRHRAWCRLDERALREELVDARRMLEQIVGGPVTRAACPFGSYDRRVLRTLRRSGYAHVYTSDGGTTGADDWVQTRNTVRRGDDPELLERIPRRDRDRYHAARRVKLALKRWR